MSSKVSSPKGGGQQADSLFYKFLIVQLDVNTFQPSFAFRWIPGGGKSANQKESAKEDSDDNKIQQFCYPESSDVLAAIYNKSQESVEKFSFVLTDSLGRKSFAYCKRIIKKTEPLCYCFISKFPYFKLFDRVIATIESIYSEKKSKYNIHSLLQALAAHPPPSSSTIIEIKTFASNSQSESFEFPFSKPRTLFDHVSYDLLFQIKPAHLIKLFECILMESRIILLSSSISLLSNTILALQSLVYPFVWQHIFVPILPISLMPYVAAPIPFLVGILDSSLYSFYQQPTEQVILYNLDKLEFLIFDPNYKSHLPYHINQYLNNSLKKLRIENSTYNSDLDVQIRKPFFSVIYHLFKNYFNYMNLRAGVYHFQKDQFLESQKGQSKGMIEHIVNSQMVEMFFSEKEKSFSEAGEINCSYLNSAREMAEVVPEYVSNVLNKYDCPVCSQTTIAETSINIHNLTIHADCFKCKQCSCSLIEMEREKVVIKKKNGGENIKIYCADCRVTFMNKSKTKFYAFIKNIQDGGNHSTHDASQSYSTFPSSMYSQPLKQQQQQQQQQQVLPVKQEILDFKFKNKGPPPKDIGRKSSSFSNLQSFLPVQKNINSTTPSSPSISPLKSTTPLKSSPLSINSNSNNNNNNNISTSIERKVPPLPPTPGERKERAMEQMKQRNLIPSDDSSTQQPLVSITPQPIVEKTGGTQFSKPLPAPRSYTISGGAPPKIFNLNEPLKPLSPLPSKFNTTNNVITPVVEVPKTLSPSGLQYKPPSVVKKSGRPLPTPPIPPQPVNPNVTTVRSTSPINNGIIKPTPPPISPRKKLPSDAVVMSSSYNNIQYGKKPLPPPISKSTPTTINFISVSSDSTGGGDLSLSSSFGSNSSGCNSEPSSPSPSLKQKPPPPDRTYPPLSLTSTQFNTQQQQQQQLQQKQYQVNNNNQKYFPGNYKNYINSISHSSTSSRQQTNNTNKSIQQTTNTTPLPLSNKPTITPRSYTNTTPQQTILNNNSTIVVNKSTPPPIVPPRSNTNSNPSPSTTPRQNPPPSINTRLNLNINSNPSPSTTPRQNPPPINSRSNPSPSTTPRQNPATTSPVLTPQQSQTNSQPTLKINNFSKHSNHIIEHQQRPSPRRLNKICSKCKEPLTCTTPINIIKAINSDNQMADCNYYHSRCFTCEKCFLPIGFEYFSYNGLLYHLSCSISVLPNCTRCNQNIKERFCLDFKNQTYHEKCFSCINCHRSLIGCGYQEHFKQYYCKRCGDSL